MPPKKIKIQSKIDKPQDNKNIIKVEKLSSKEEKSSSEEDKKDNDSEKDNTTIEKSMSIIKPSKSIKDPIIEQKETEVKKKEPEVKKKEPEVKKKEPEVKKKEPEVKKKEPEVKKTQSIASTPDTATKPKIEEVKQTNNTVDMFDEDDLDVRNVMMNYDYTKNKTNPRITKYEMALLIGKRATQIECGATPNIKISPGQSVISIAEEELRQRKIPLIIKRPIGNTFEYWKPEHMEVSMN
jgi:DNA-directed RNA polymerase subunit K/omega